MIEKKDTLWRRIQNLAAPFLIPFAFGAALYGCTVKQTCLADGDCKPPSSCIDSICQIYESDAGVRTGAFYDAARDAASDNDLASETSEQEDIGGRLFTCFLDHDRDGYPIKEKQMRVHGDEQVCPLEPEQYLPDGPFDCDDDEPTNHPEGTEVCDRRDNNCNFLIDEGLDCCWNRGETRNYEPCPQVEWECVSPSDIVVAIDNSGSMADNDPSDIRYEGLRQFIDEMRASRALFVPFDDTYLVVGQFSSDKAVLRNNLITAASYGRGGGTDIGSALTASIAQFEESEEREKAVIALTDGNSSYNPVHIRDQAVRRNIALYTLGLGADVAESILQETATPDGGYFFIEQAEQIPALLRDLLREIDLPGEECFERCAENYQWLRECQPCCGR